MSFGNNRYQYLFFVIVIILISFAESKFVLQVLDVSNGGVLFSGRGCSPGQRLPSYHFNLDPDLVWEPTTFCKQSYRCFLPVFISTTTFFQFFTAEDRAQRVVLQ